LKWNSARQNIHLNSGEKMGATPPFTTTQRSFLRWHQLVPGQKKGSRGLVQKNYFPTSLIDISISMMISEHVYASGEAT
jgi:hypothetical protein